MSGAVARLGRQDLLDRIGTLENHIEVLKREHEVRRILLNSIVEINARLESEAVLLRARVGTIEEGEEFALMKANLDACQSRCTALTDEVRGWRSSKSSHPFSGQMNVLGDVIAERWRQDAKWGVASSRVGIPDGTGGSPLFDAEAYAMAAKEACDRAFAEGCGSFLRILAEEFAEVVAESDPARLRAELIQVAAVAALWCEVIDLRERAAKVSI